MSIAATPADASVTDAVPVARGKKKLIIIIAAALLLVLTASGGAAYYFWLRTPHATPEAAENDAADAPPAEPRKKEARRSAPVFLPLELFTVNLADREAERYAQVGVTLEVADTKTSDQLKAYMPVIRNDILMLLAHKRAAELQERAGKVALAREIRRAALKPLAADASDPPAGDSEADDEPVRAVHFSSFIIQ
jgi:flagellar protein FliL